MIKLKFFIILILSLVVLILGIEKVHSLQSGFAPCIQEGDKVYCDGNKFTPLWDSLCPKCDIEIQPVKISPGKSNAFDSCRSCHNKPDSKFQFSNWQTKYHDKHKAKNISCNSCHKLL